MDELNQYADQDNDLCWISRSLLDDGVWVPHLPNSDIATSEGHAGTRLWEVKQYVEQKAGYVGRWMRNGRNQWIYEEDC